MLSRLRWKRGEGVQLPSSLVYVCMFNVNLLEMQSFPRTGLRPCSNGDEGNAYSRFHRHVIRHQQKEDRTRLRKQLQQQQQQQPQPPPSPPRARRKSSRRCALQAEPVTWACSHCRLVFHKNELLELHLPLHSAAVIPSDSADEASGSQGEQCPDCELVSCRDWIPIGLLQVGFHAGINEGMHVDFLI